MEARSAREGERAPGPPRHPWIPAAVIALLAAHYVLAYSATLGASTTFDEPLHMVAGVAYWTLDDYRLQPENGNLPQRWCAIPLVFMNLAFPSLEQTIWRQSEATLLGRQYLYACGNDPQAMLAASRAMATVWSTGLCLVIFLWSRSIFGAAGGLVSLALAAFWPALVAHGPLATSDACGALFFTLGAWSIWELFQRITPGTLAAACLSLGLAPIAKHSNVMLAPLALVYLAVVAALGRPLIVDLGPWKTVVRGRGPRTALAVAALFGPLLAAVFFIWASCGFRYAAGAATLGGYEFPRYPTLARCNEHAGTMGRLCELLAAWRLLPEAWLYGMSFIAAHMRSRYAFAIGRYSIDGWWWYFPLCFAIKNTLPSLLLSLVGIGVACRGLLGRIGRRLPLDPATYASLAPLGILVVLWPTFLASHLNIGERHLLPSYPALMVLAGGTLATASSAWIRRAVVVLLAFHAIDVATRWPSPLPYFNQVVPRGREYRWLVDSNLDWGQDLLRLQTWLDRQPEPHEPVYACYFGSDLVDRVLPGAESIGVAPARGEPQILEPGLYCISATFLQGIYAEPLGPWCAAFEATYQRARGFVAAAAQRDRSTGGAAEAPADAEVREAAVSAFNRLQAGRLRAFLRHREPDADVGRSILIFRLSAAELMQALAGPPAELEPISWMERDSGGDAAALVRRGDRLVAEGSLVEAQETLEQATRLDPANAIAWDRLGLVYAARDRLDDALAAYEAALARDADFAPAYLNRGLLKLRQGAKQAAASDLARYRDLGGRLPPDLEKLLDGPPQSPRP